MLKLKDLFGPILAMNSLIADQVIAYMDSNDDGHVDVHEFTVTMAMLLKGTSLEDKISIAFDIFDRDRNGSLEKDEFRALLNAAINSQLVNIINSTTAQRFLASYMRKEFSLENLDFYQRASNLEGLHGLPRARESIAIYEHFIARDAESEINVSSKTKTQIETRLADVRAWAKAAEADAKENEEDTRVCPHPNLYNDAALEIFKLIRADTFVRFKSNKTVIDRMVNAFWSAAACKKVGEVTYKAFRKFAVENKEMLSFVDDLKRGTETRIADQAGRESWSSSLEYFLSVGISGEDLQQAFNKPKGAHRRSSTISSRLMKNEVKEEPASTRKSSDVR